MQISAVARGTLGGAALAIILAVVLAWLDYDRIVGGIWLTAVFWTAAGTVFLFSGFVAARSAEAGFWIHGALAAFSLNLVGSIVAESLGRADAHLWLDLAFSAVVGLIGGVSGSLI